MKAQHLFEENIYFISNHSVARNPLFTDSEVQDYFQNKMEFYLGDICNILNYTMNDNEFQIMVKLKPRENFEELFKRKKKKEIKEEDIPHSTYIFSQQMANLQVSLVKKINFKYKRSGALMAGRFKRELISNEDILKKYLHRMNEGEKVHEFGSTWKNRGIKAKKIRTGRWIYGLEDLNKLGHLEFLNGFKPDLVDTFKKLPPLSLNPSKKYFFSPLHHFSNSKSS